MRHRPNDGAAIDDLREARQPLADATSGNAARDAAQPAADLERGVGLGVEGFELADAAVEEQEEDRLRLAEPRQRSVRRGRGRRRREAESAKGADAQEVAAG